MTTHPPPTEAQRQRALRRRHQRERQAVVFGALIAGLVLVGLGAAAVYSGVVSSPFKRAFSTPTPTVEVSQPIPCLPDGTLPVAYKDVSMRILNGTDQAGLANEVATAFKERGFTVTGTGNFTPRPLAATVRVVAGPNGLAAAYTLAAQVVNARIALDGRADASVDLVVGKDFTALLDPSLVTLSPDKPMASQVGCVPLETIVPKTPPAAPVSPKAS